MTPCVLLPLLLASMALTAHAAYRRARMLPYVLAVLLTMAVTVGAMIAEVMP